MRDEVVEATLGLLRSLRGRDPEIVRLAYRHDPERMVFRPPAFRAVLTLGRAALPGLLRALEEEELEEWAVLAIGLLGVQAREAAPALRARLAAPSPAVRALAAEALADADRTPRTGEDLVPLLADPAVEVRRSVVAGLAALGSAADPAAGALYRLLVDEEDAVARAWARRAVRNLTPTAVATASHIGPTARYLFAHVVLRDRAISDPEGTIRALRSREATALLERVWEEVRERGRKAGRGTAPGAADCAVHVREVAGRACVVIQPPPPARILEAHFIALVPAAGVPGGLDAETAGEPLRYFTLERTDPELVPSGTMLCQWTAEGTHRNLGEGPPPGLNALLAALERILRNRSGR